MYGFFVVGRGVRWREARFLWIGSATVFRALIEMVGSCFEGFENLRGFWLRMLWVWD